MHKIAINKANSLSSRLLDKKIQSLRFISLYRQKLSNEKYHKLTIWEDFEEMQ